MSVAYQSHEDDEARHCREVYEKVIRPRLKRMKLRQAWAVILYYGLEGEEPHTLQAIGDLWGGVSRERIRQLIHKAMRVLKHPSVRLGRAHNPDWYDYPSSASRFYVGFQPWSEPVVEEAGPTPSESWDEGLRIAIEDRYERRRVYGPMTGYGEATHNSGRVVMAVPVPDPEYPELLTWKYVELPRVYSAGPMSDVL